MRWGLFENVFKRLKDSLEIPVLPYEPNWNNWVSFPVAWIELEKEEIREGMSSFDRKIPIVVYIAHRGLFENVEQIQQQIYDLSDQVEQLLTNHAFAVDGKKVLLLYKGWDPFKDLKVENNQTFFVFVTAIHFEARTRR
ncbi:MAG: hypothetical protein DRP25_05080 [Thermotoga sp.]|nr:MAG: hypothetical protein DRP25_05080 [Thermotoga sp.]